MHTNKRKMNRYIFNDYLYIASDGAARDDQLLLGGMEIIPNIMCLYSGIAEKLRDILERVFPNCGNTDWMKLIGEVNEKIKIQKKIHHKLIIDTRKRLWKWRQENPTIYYGTYQYNYEKTWEESISELLHVYFEFDVTSGFIEELVEYINIREESKRSLLKYSRLPESIIDYEILKFM